MTARPLLFLDVIPTPDQPDELQSALERLETHPLSGDRPERIRDELRTRRADH